MNCPCGQALAYEHCCGLYIEQGRLPETAEQLMRSRYTAYSQANITYIERTMRHAALVGFDAKQAKSWASQAQWLKLEVKHHRLLTDNPQQAEVEFIAYYRLHQQLQTIHEISLFQYINDRWFYIDGQQPATITSAKVGRNQPCPCGSGKKYKKCCG